MSEVRLMIREADRDWSGTVHGSAADCAIAALSADCRLRRELVAEVSEETQAALQADLVRLEDVIARRSRELVKHFESMLEHRLAFSRGGWVDLLPGPNTFGWQIDASEIHYDNATGIWTAIFVRMRRPTSSSWIGHCIPRTTCRPANPRTKSPRCVQPGTFSGM